MENEKTKKLLLNLQGRILKYGKENLYDTLHFTSTGLSEAFSLHGIQNIPRGPGGRSPHPPLRPVGKI